ncbi:uncharacterized protein LOC132917429 [Rhopalosiphum padi]|uniref:uncharacterized protein LOC132917429 n=1 Tax=Rhopalosiphum padi TaxID=40932 RepID=UPI00298DB665|nr:uncharacterized protein LOC132917429 [Rhopalosiphum padi]
MAVRRLENCCVDIFGIFALLFIASLVIQFIMIIIYNIHTSAQAAERSSYRAVLCSLQTLWRESKHRIKCSASGSHCRSKISTGGIYTYFKLTKCRNRIYDCPYNIIIRMRIAN